MACNFLQFACFSPCVTYGDLLSLQLGFRLRCSHQSDRRSGLRGTNDDLLLPDFLDRATLGASFHNIKMAWNPFLTTFSSSIAYSHRLGGCFGFRRTAELNRCPGGLVLLLLVANDNFLYSVVGVDFFNDSASVRHCFLNVNMAWDRLDLAPLFLSIANSHRLGLRDWWQFRVT